MSMYSSLATLGSWVPRLWHELLEFFCEAESFCIAAASLVSVLLLSWSSHVCHTGVLLILDAARAALKPSFAFDLIGLYLFDLFDLFESNLSICFMPFH